MKTVFRSATFLLCMGFGLPLNAGPMDEARAALALAGGCGSCSGGSCPISLPSAYPSCPTCSVTSSYSWHFFADNPGQAALVCNGKQVGTYVFANGEYFEKTGRMKWKKKPSQCPCAPPASCPVTGDVGRTSGSCSTGNCSGGSGQRRFFGGRLFGGGRGCRGCGR